LFTTSLRLKTYTNVYTNIHGYMGGLAIRALGQCPVAMFPLSSVRTHTDCKRNAHTNTCSAHTFPFKKWFLHIFHTCCSKYR